MLKLILSPNLESRFASHKTRLESSIKHLHDELHTTGLEDSQRRMRRISDSVTSRSLPINVSRHFSFLQNTIRNHHFFGRQECMDELDSCLASGSTMNEGSRAQPWPTESVHDPASEAPAWKEPHPHATASSRHICSVVIYGLGGCGKSSVAKEYMFRRRDSYDIVLWFYADGQEKLETQFWNVARTLCLTTTETDARENVLRWLDDTGICFPVAPPTRRRRRELGTS